MATRIQIATIGRADKDPQIEQAEDKYEELVMNGTSETDAMWLAVEHAGLKDAPHTEPASWQADSRDAAGVV